MATTDQRIPDMFLSAEEPANKPDDGSLYDDTGGYVYFLNDYSYSTAGQNVAPAHFMASPGRAGGHMTVLEDYAVESSEPTPL